MALQFKKNYQAALEQYIKDPAPVQALLNRRIFQDNEGPFTGKHLLLAVKNEMRKVNISISAVYALGTAMVVVPVIIYVSNFIFNGHENIYKYPGINKNLIIEQFSPDKQPVVEQMLGEMDKLGLIQINPKTNFIQTITPLGKRLLDKKES